MFSRVGASRTWVPVFGEASTVEYRQRPNLAQLPDTFASCSGPFVFRAWFGLGDSVFGVLLLEGLGGIVLYVVRGLGRLCHRKENMVSLLW